MSPRLVDDFDSCARVRVVETEAMFLVFLGEGGGRLSMASERHEQEKHNRYSALQARSEEVDTMNRPIKKGNVDFAEVMLATYGFLKPAMPYEHASVNDAAGLLLLSFPRQR